MRGARAAGSAKTTRSSPAEGKGRYGSLPSDALPEARVGVNGAITHTRQSAGGNAEPTLQ